MHARPRTTAVLAISTLALLMVTAARADAQAIDRSRIFDVTVEIEGQIIGASIREGEPLRLTVHRAEEYEVSPVLPGGQGAVVVVAISRRRGDEPGATEIIERLSVREGVPVTMRAHPGLKLVIDRIRYATPVAARATGRPISFALLRGAASTDYCCVCCDGVCACACGVVTDGCGHCCVGECCPMIHPTDGPAGENSQRIRNARLARFLGSNTCEKVFPEAVARIASTL